MPLSTPFTCPKGHSFTANAKLRARCPECGTMARKSFNSSKGEPPDPAEPPPSNRIDPVAVGTEPDDIEPEPIKSVQVIRRGRQRTKSMPKPQHRTVSKKHGIVKHRTVRRTLVPSVTGKPTGNREHKITEREDGPYWHKVADKYGL